MKIEKKEDLHKNTAIFLDFLNTNQAFKALEFARESNLSKIDFLYLTAREYPNEIELSLYNPIVLCINNKLNINDFKELISYFDHDVLLDKYNVEEEEIKEASGVKKNDKKIRYYKNKILPFGRLFLDFLEVYKLHKNEVEYIEKTKENLADIYKYFKNEMNLKITLLDIDYIMLRFKDDFRNIDVIESLNTINIPDETKKSILSYLLLETYENESFLTKENPGKKEYYQEFKNKIREVLNNDLDYNSMVDPDPHLTDHSYVNLLFENNELDEINNIVTNKKMEIEKESGFFIKIIKQYIKENDVNKRKEMLDLIILLIDNGLDLDQKVEDPYVRRKSERLIDIINDSITTKSFDFFSYPFKKREETRASKIKDVVNTQKIKIEKKLLANIFNQVSDNIKNKKRL